MSGTTIGNWGAFEKDMFSGMRVSNADAGLDVHDFDQGGVLAAKVTEVKEGHLHASTVKKIFLGILSFGIYNICHAVSARNQRATTAALKQGIDDIHGALSYLATVSHVEFQRKGQKGLDAGTPASLLKGFGGGGVGAGVGAGAAGKGKVEHLSIVPSTDEDRNLFPSPPGRLMHEDNSELFVGGDFIRLSVGGVEVDIGRHGANGATVRLNGVKSMQMGSIFEGMKEVDYSIVTLPNIEHSLFQLEKDIVRTADIFGGDLVEKMLTRYDRRLALEQTVNGEESTGVLNRSEIKDRQLELSRDVLVKTCGMSPDRVAYLDRDLAKQLAIQAVKGNVTSGPALDTHYDKIVSQRHLVDADMLALYKNLDEAGDVSGQIHLPAAAPQAAPAGAGRPTAQQQRVHDFAADLILTEDLSEYDKDIGQSGHLDGQRLRNVFEKHQDLIASLMTARASDRNAAPAALGSLDPSVRAAVVKLLDSLLDQKAQRAQKAGKGDVDPPAQFLTDLIAEFDNPGGDKLKARAIIKQAVASKAEMDDVSKERQFNEAHFGASPEDEFSLRQRMAGEGASADEINAAVDRLKNGEAQFDYRRHGKANFFAQIEIELNKSIDEAMANTVQANVKRMIAGVFPRENPAALDSTSPLATIVSDRASDPQMKLLKQTLDVYFERMGSVDKRNMMARLVRHTVEGAPDGMRFGEILKGAGPVLQKMMQGLDPDAFTDPNFRLAIADMRSKLAPIPEKAVKAQFKALIDRSNGAIVSIDVVRALGAASVGQTFLCSIQMRGEARPRECVVKMLRPDAHLRALREAEVFREVARTIDGMSRTFEGKFSGIMKELDLTLEADNVKTGLDVYDAGTHKVNKTFSNVSSMRLSEIPGTEPTKGVMVLERAPGVPMDKFLEDANASITADRATALDGIGNRPPEDVLMSMLDGAESLTKTYADALEKHDALTNLTTIWIREGLFTKTGFYHGDLHAGNIMVPTQADVGHGVPNGVTMIDFGNATKLSSEEQKNVIRIVAGAAGNDPELFLNGLNELLSPEGRNGLRRNRQDVERIVRDIFAKGTANDAGLRMTAVFKLLQARFSIEVPPVISGFQSSQERLTVAMESMLRTMTSAEMARLDVILAAARKDGADVPAFAGNLSPAQLFAQKKAAALAYLQAKLDGKHGAISDLDRDRIGNLVKEINAADEHRPKSMMQCMVAVIKQNLLTSLAALGTNSAQTVKANLEASGILGAARADPASSEKERRFVQIWG